MTRKRTARPEQRLQKHVLQHLRQRGVPHLVFIHVPNGGKRKPIEAAILKGQGVRKGASDLLLWHGGSSFALELKAEGGKPTAEQVEFLQDMQKAGANSALATGLSQALAQLERWGLLRGVAT